LAERPRRHRRPFLDLSEITLVGINAENAQKLLVTLAVFIVVIVLRKVLIALSRLIIRGTRMRRRDSGRAKR